MHYDTTAEEIFDQCDGQIDMIVRIYHKLETSIVYI